jgi:stage III sporulation protein AB
LLTKVVGVGLVVSVTGWIGLQKAYQLTRRTRAIRQMRMDLDFLEKEINYARNPLEEALKRTAHVSSEPVKGFFERVSRALQEDMSTPAREAWNQGVGYLCEQQIFTADDLAIIALIGTRIGASDASDQIRMLRQAGAELKMQEEKSRQQEDSEKKLWSYGGFLVGLMISILMI